MIPYGDFAEMGSDPNVATSNAAAKSDYYCTVNKRPAIV